MFSFCQSLELPLGVPPDLPTPDPLPSPGAFPLAAESWFLVRVPTRRASRSDSWEFTAEAQTQQLVTPTLCIDFFAPSNVQSATRISPPRFKRPECLPGPGLSLDVGHFVEGAV